MTETLDPSTILLAVAAVALFGLFFWIVAYRFWRDGRRFADLLDAGSQSKCGRLAHEAKHGTPLAWKQAPRRLVQLALILALLGLAWLRLRGS